MGSGPNNSMVITSGKPLPQAATDYGLYNTLPQARGIQPDLTDSLLAQQRKSQMLRMLQGQGRASTFLTGPVGDMTAPKSLLG